MHIIGKGASATIFATSSVDRMGEMVAIKRIPTKMRSAAEIQEEVAIMRCLHHENVVAFYGHNRDVIYHYITMELVEGGDLFEYVCDKDKLVECEAAFIAEQILFAIQYIHSQGVLHRDIKLENVVYDSDTGTVKLIDFGLAKRMHVSIPNGAHGRCGSVEYVAPEVIGLKPYGKPADVWSFGVLTYCMLVGWFPFNLREDGERRWIDSYETATYDWVGADHVSDSARAFIASILVKQPAERATIPQCLESDWILQNEEEEDAK